MKLPAYHRAVVPKPKITDYLMSPTHPGGWAKARWFGDFGFTAERWTVLANALKEHASENAVKKQEDSQFGTRYTIEGVIYAPDGREPLIRSVWFVEAGEEIPRFVTAYPLKRRK